MRRLIYLIVAAALTGCQCGGGKAEYTVGGTVVGLAGTGLVLQNVGRDDLTIDEAGEFTFATELEDGSDYFVSIAQPPTDAAETCAVANAAGTLEGADVTDVIVTCAVETFFVRGSVTGLEGSGLVLQNNATYDLAVLQDGAIVFATPLPDGSPYEVTVLTQPSDPGQTCAVASATGNVDGGDVFDVQVTCTTDPTYGIGVTVTGLIGPGLVLQNNGADDLIVDFDGDHVFSTEVPDGSGYDVTIKTVPPAMGQQCAVQNGTGTVAGADVGGPGGPTLVCQCADWTVDVFPETDIFGKSAVSSSHWVLFAESGEDGNDDHMKLYARCGDVAHLIGQTGDYAWGLGGATIVGFGPKKAINEAGSYAFQAEYDALTILTYETPTALYTGRIGQPPQLVDDLHPARDQRERADRLQGVPVSGGRGLRGLGSAAPLHPRRRFGGPGLRRPGLLRERPLPADLRDRLGGPASVQRRGPPGRGLRVGQPGRGLGPAHRCRPDPRAGRLGGDRPRRRARGGRRALPDGHQPGHQQRGHHRVPG
ncbi:MAG: hypothetical protein JRI25_01515 [Deltaproteobacteria bacterium]|nr:hypothetical protein [Deltaproteobacteria bacterium]